MRYRVIYKDNIDADTPKNAIELAAESVKSFDVSTIEGFMTAMPLEYNNTRFFSVDPGVGLFGIRIKRSPFSVGVFLGKFGFMLFGK